MKRFIIALFSAALCLSCQEQVEEAVAPSLEFSQDVISFPCGGSSLSFDITANNEWSAEIGGEETWFTIDKASGSAGTSTVNVSVEGFTGHRSRIGCIIVRSAGLISQVTVAQVPAPNNDRISVSPEALEYTYAGGTQTVSLTSNVDWTATYDADWLTLDVKSGKASSSAAQLKFTAATNNGKSMRKATVVFEGGDAAPVEFEVSQEAFESIILTPNTLAFDAKGGEQSVSVEANVAWTAQSSASWLKLDKSSGEKGVAATVKVTAEANTADDPREATITFKGGTQAEETITVRQKGSSLTVVTLMSFKNDDPAYTDSHSPDWSTTGANDYSKGTGKGIALPEESGSTGYMKFVSGGVFTYTASKPLTYITAKEGHFAVKPIFTNDAFEFHIPVTSIAAGSVLRMQTGLRGVVACPMYWAFKFSIDGGTTWITAESNNMQTAKNGESSNAQITKKDTVFPINAWGTITSDIASGEILVRIQCVDGTWQVQGSSVTSPTAGATVRLTPFTDKDGKSQAGPIITLEY